MPEHRPLLRRFARLCRSAASRLLWQHTTLEPFFDGADDVLDGSVVELRESVSLGGIARPAVAVTAGAGATCRVYPPAGAVLDVHCGIVGSPDDRVRFAVEFDGAPAAACVAGAGRWTALRVPVKERETSRPLAIVLRTSLLAGSAVTTQPFWGSPALHWRRSLADAGGLIVRALRQYGARGALTRFVAHGSADVRESSAAYGAWLAARTPSRAELDAMRRTAAASPGIRFAVVVTGTDEASRARTIDSLAQQVHGAWEAWLWSTDGRVSPDLQRAIRNDSRLRFCADARTEADARNAAAGGSSADYLVALDAGDELVPHAFYEIAARAGARPDATILYSDEDRHLRDGFSDARFKPDWSPEYLESRMYLGKLLAAKRTDVLGAGGYRPGLDGAHDYDAALRLCAVSDSILHVPAVLCHASPIEQYPSTARLAAERRALQDFCRLTGRNATVTAASTPGTWRVRQRLNGTPRVTIVIPTDARSNPSDGSQSLVAQCIRSIVERTTYPNYDLVVADNGRCPSDAQALLDRVPHERISYAWTGDFNFSRKINFAVTHARGEYVLLLNDDVEVINGEWLAAMLEYAGRERIGAVGAKLFYPDGRLQHVGVVTGVCGVAAHLLHQYPAGSAGCGQIAVTARNCSAVTGACLLTRRQVYDEVGGFDERLAVDFNDVDFCLRVRAAGYRIVFTPYAKLYHHESGSFGPRVQHPRDIQAMHAIWGSALDRDPYYNPNLSRDFPDCRLSGDAS